MKWIILGCSVFCANIAYATHYAYTFTAETAGYSEYSYEEFRYIRPYPPSRFTGSFTGYVSYGDYTGHNWTPHLEISTRAFGEILPFAYSLDIKPDGFSWKCPYHHCAEEISLTIDGDMGRLRYWSVAYGSQIETYWTLSLTDVRGFVSDTPFEESFLRAQIPLPASFTLFLGALGFSGAVGKLMKRRPNGTKRCPA